VDYCNDILTGTANEQMKQPTATAMFLKFSVILLFLLSEIE